MAFDTKLSKQQEKYGSVKRSVLRNLLLSMLAFGLFVGLIFPPFAKTILNTDKAYSPIFISLCVVAGLLVGIFNFFIFRILVSRELNLIQKGMRHVHENIADVEVLEENCISECTLDITSADIIGDISISFNSMTHEVFKRLELDGESQILNSKLMHSTELENVADTILSRMAAVMGAKAGLLYGGKLEKMQLLSDFGVDKTDEIINILTDRFGPIEKALKTGNILSYSQLDGWEWFSQSTPLGSFRPGSILLIPLMTKQQSVGLVVLACGIQRPSPQQKKTLETLRSFAAPYLDNSILHKRITELAAIDDLTNILNRRFGMRRLKEEYSRASRHGVPISAVMFDIDHFKNFNDTFGHNAGDAVLKMVASTLQENLRAEDMVCRYGGEEFLMGIAGAGMNDSALITERIRRAVETNHIRWGNKQLSVTISSGVATYPVVRASICEELITAADKALYAAKEFGRNQVTVNDGTQILRFSDLKLGETSENQ
ncbi:MAG: sensor domain-containing diguanylate cyclase [Anaerolineaceae bacterium]|nr:sensor domain-containing diguanylate cyclase [Anaerolineaceae bacterium]